MDADLRELYQEMILDHKSRPRNFRVIEDANRTADGSNPLFGDKIRLYLSVDADKAAPRGVNVVALRRNGFAEDVIAVLVDAYRLVYREKMALDEIRESFRRNGRLVPHVTQLLSFVEMQQAGRPGRPRDAIRSAA